MPQTDVFVVAAARTAIGTFGGTLKDTPPVDLATTAIKAALARNPIKGIEGSQRTVIDPLESIIRNTYLFAQMAQRNEVGLIHMREEPELVRHQAQRELPVSHFQIRSSFRSWSYRALS